MKNIKITIIISVILLVIFGGVLLYTMGGDETTINNDEPESFDTDNNILSATPPGITETNNNKLEIDAQELIESHKNILDKNSLTVQNTNNNIPKEISKDSTAIYSETNRHNENQMKYSEGEYTVFNVQSDNSNTYSVENNSINTNKYTKENKFESFVQNLKIDTFSEKDSGEVEIRLIEDEELNSIKNRYGFEEIDSISVTLIITTDGLIKESDVEVIGTVNNIRAVHTETYEVTNLDTTTVQKPNWVNSAENSVAIVDGNYDILQGWILIQHNGLSTIPEGETIEITDLDTNEIKTVELPDNFGEDDRLGLSLLEDGEWAVTINETPPEGANSNSSSYKVRAENNGQEYFNIRLKS